MSIGLAYSGTGGTFNLVFKEFTGADIPRKYDTSTSFTRSASGATSFGGSPSRQKYIWAISCLVTKDDAITLDSMFRAWDEDRASGRPAGCGLTDETFGASITTTVLFTTPPSFIYLTKSLTQVDFGVVEV